MGNILFEEQAVKISSFKGIDVYRILSRKFKTNSINVFIHHNLTEEQVTRNAMVPAVLRRGCRSFPQSRDIALYLEGLYGASFDCGIAKKGETQITQFYIECISDKYTDQGTDIFNKAFDLLYEIITQPIVENGAFKDEYIIQEKDNLKRLIEGRVNNKLQYAVDRCFEEMCHHEPFGIYEYGYVSQLKDINPENLYHNYCNSIGASPISVYIAGDVDDDKLNRVMDKFRTMERGDITAPNAGIIHNDVAGIREVNEKMKINQAKLSLGFRTGIAANHDDYYALLVYDGILGGGIHSKLFQNVREKAGLAYYIFSRMERFKGLMVVSGGIESENKDRTFDIIMDQMNEIRKGNISNYELEATLKTIETGIGSLKDSQMQIVDFCLSQSIAGSHDNFSSFLQKVSKVTIDDVVRIAEKVKLDTVYFLAPG